MCDQPFLSYQAFDHSFWNIHCTTEPSYYKQIPFKRNSAVRQRDSNVSAAKSTFAFSSLEEVLSRRPSYSGPTALLIYGSVQVLKV